MLDKYGFASFRSRDGRLLYGRIIGISDRRVTVKVFGPNSIHRLAFENVASVVLPLTIDEMIKRNKKSRSAADRRKEVNVEMKATHKRRMERGVNEGFPTRYDYFDGPTQ